MPVELVVPSVGESITEVEIGDWLKHPGDVVNQDDPVVVIETEKVTVELPAPAAGKITTMLKQKGEKASVGDVIGYMEPNGTGAREAQARQGAASSEETPARSSPVVSVDVPRIAEESKPVQVKPAVAKSGREEQVVPMTP